MPPVKKPSRVRQKTFLREWREYRGYSQEAAAEMVGMSRENLSRIENGKVPYNQDVLEQLAGAYSCEVADLVVRNPKESAGLWSIWSQAKESTRNVILEVAKTISAIPAGTRYFNHEVIEDAPIRKNISTNQIYIPEKFFPSPNDPIEIAQAKESARNLYIQAQSMRERDREEFYKLIDVMFAFQVQNPSIEKIIVDQGPSQRTEVSRRSGSKQ